jgi:uncharacterized repeat protein (TIGR03803 family)
MKPVFHVFHLAFALTVGVLTLWGHAATAQTLTVLHTFTNSPDGDRPAGGLLLSSNLLYATTQLGGAAGVGTVFRCNADGSDLTNLFSFTPLSGRTNGTGAYPGALLAQSGNMLFGVSFYGGVFGVGMIFRINIDGTGFTNLYSFSALVGLDTNSDGAYPTAALLVSSNTLYGTASQGGAWGLGTLFRINTDGTGFTNFYTFTSSESSSANSPSGNLILSGGKLYGTAAGGGFSEEGTLFQINTNAQAMPICITSEVSSMVHPRAT